MPVSDVVPGQNEGLFDCDPWLDDVDAISQQYEQNLRRLFVEEDQNDVQISVIDVDAEYQIVRSAEALAKVLSRDTKTARIIVIPQEYSWGRLRASPECMSIILKSLRPFAALAEILQAFGERITPSNESMGRHCSRKSSKREEQCYLLKCAEHHDRGNAKNPWSLRQYAIYEQFDALAARSTYLVLNPSASRMLRDNLNQSLSGRHHSRAALHLMMVAASSTNWSPYTSSLEDELLALSPKAFLDSGPRKRGLQLETEDLQRLQHLQDKLLRARQQVSIDIEVVRALDRDLSLDNPFEDVDQSVGEGQAIRSILSSFLAQERRIESILGRASALSGYMQSILSTRSLQTLDANGKVTAQMAQLAQDDNRLMMDLSRESQKDSRTLKTITILALAYLPVSFVSTLMSMGYISIDYQDGQGRLLFRPEMWIFFFLSCVLLFLTFGSWLTLEVGRSLREARAKKDQEAAGGRVDPYEKSVMLM